MAETSEKRKLNVAQRKALEKLLRESYAAKVKKEAEDEWSHQREIQKQILAEVKRELGIDEMEEQVHELQERMERLGIVRPYDVPQAGSQARKVYDEKLSRIEEEQNSLRKELEEKIARIWTAETVEEAEAILQLS